MKHHLNGHLADQNLGGKNPGQTEGIPSVAFGEGANATTDAYTRTQGQQPPAVSTEGAEGALGALSTAPRRKNPLWMNVISVFLAFTLSLMAWNETSIAEARTAILGDAPTAADGDSSASDPSEADANDDATDPSANGEDGEGDGDATDGENGEDPQSDAPNFEELGLQAITALGEAELAEFMPEGLVAADAVLPAISDEAQEKRSDTTDNAASMKDEELQEAFAERLNFSMTATGALQDSDGNYQVNGQELTLTPSFGNLARQLDGGYLGACEDNDGVAVVFNAPYVYRTALEGQTDEDGNQAYEFHTTLSEEEWKYRGGDADGMRVVLSTDDVPQGWSVYTQHGTQFLKHTEKELEKGLSGVILFRYDGAQDENGVTVKTTRNQLRADAQLPQMTAHMLGEIPADQAVSVSGGFVANSFTAARDEDNKLKGNNIVCPTNQQTAASFTLVNAEATVALGTSVEMLAQPTFTPDAEGNGEGIAAFLLTITAAKGEFTEKGYQLNLADLPDAEGRGGMNADGVRAFDITALSDEDKESLNLADAAALEGAGLEALNAQVEEDVPGRAVLDIPVEGNPQLTELPANATAADEAAQPKRQIVVLVPYSAPALVHISQGNENATNPDLIDATNQLLSQGLPADEGEADPTYDVTTLEATLVAQVEAELVQEELVEKEGQDNALEEEEGTIAVALPQQMLQFAYQAPAPEEPEDPEAPENPAEGDDPTEGNNQETPGEQPTEGDEPQEPTEPEADASQEEIEALANPITFSMAQAGLALYQAAPRAASPYKTLDPTKHFDLWLNVQGANKRIADGVYLVSNQESPIVQTNVKDRKSVV